MVRLLDRHVKAKHSRFPPVGMVKGRLYLPCSHEKHNPTKSHSHLATSWLTVSCSQARTQEFQNRIIRDKLCFRSGRLTQKYGASYVGPRESVSQDRILARDSVSLQDLAPIVNIMACRHFELMMLINRRFPRDVVVVRGTLGGHVF